MARLDAISVRIDERPADDRAANRAQVDPRRGDWQDDAACRGSDTSVFFPASEADATAAQAICATCPVAEACLEYAIATRQSDGVWGGLTPAERHRLVRRRQKAARKARAAAARDAAA
jgi:WhiB family transcriptional regulator, redox-sensing transcriptional regulator